MSKQTPPSFPRYRRLAGSMGERLRLARLHRRMSATEMAERMGVSRMTLHSLEKGDLSVGLGILVRALGVLGLEGDLDRLAADDELGRKLADAAARPSRRVKRVPAP
jgi:transcriptional regulator with XRE-family HTH domain